MAAAKKPVLQCRFFKTERGNEPVRDWLKDDLSATVRKQIGGDIQAVQWGWPIGKPLVDGSFGDGLYEVRTNVAGEQYRIFFSIIEGVMVLLHGIHKKTKTTPKADIDLARQRQSILRTNAPPKTKRK